MVALLIFPVAQCTMAAGVTPSTPQEALKQSCAIYAENWQGLRYHYTEGKKIFLRQCLTRIRGKNLVEGLWAIRAMLPDGHAEFQILETDHPAQIFPLLLVYDVVTREVRVEAAFDPALRMYIGKRVLTINNASAMDLLRARSVLEPQSSLDSSLEIAARTMTVTLPEKPYPAFPERMDLVFDDASNVSVSPMDVEPLTAANRHVLSANGYPSLWGATGISAENEYCLGKNEIAKQMIVNGERWFWWHPRALYFDLEDIESAFSCWEAGVQDTDGVVLDLRDTAGGDLGPLYVLGHQFEVKMPTTINSLVSDGEISVARVRDAGGELGPRTSEGYPRELAMKTPNAAQRVSPWAGKLVVITNGLCGSACEMLAYYLQSRAETCSYGTPTAGRLIGSDTVHPVPPADGLHIDLSVPIVEYLTPNGSRWEGRPVIPTHMGSGGVAEAIDTCDRARSAAAVVGELL